MNKIKIIKIIFKYLYFVYCFIKIKYEIIAGAIIPKCEFSENNLDFVLNHQTIKII